MTNSNRYPTQHLKTLPHSKGHPGASVAPMQAKYHHIIGLPTARTG